MGLYHRISSITPPYCGFSRHVLAPKFPICPHGVVPMLAISLAHLTSQNLIHRFLLCRPRFQQFRRSFRGVQPAWPAQRHIKFRARRAPRRRKPESRLDQAVPVRREQTHSVSGRLRPAGLWSRWRRGGWVAKSPPERSRPNLLQEFATGWCP